MQLFGQYAISFSPPEVRRGERAVRLTPKQFGVLVLLVKARGKTVKKDTFFKRVWKGEAIEESNLSQTVFLIRRALGKLPDGTEYIENIPGQGYRLAPGAVPVDGPAKFGLDTLIQADASGSNKLGNDSHFRLLVESIEDYAIYFLDPTGRVLTWNRGAEAIKGYKRDEVLGQHYSLFFVPEDITSRVPERELAVAAANGPSFGESWRMRKNGERFWANFALTAVRSEGGKLLGYAKIVRDIGERKRHEDVLLGLEAGLRRERDRLRAVAEGSMDAIYICEAVRDRNGGIEDFIFTYANQNVGLMINFTHEHLLGNKMCELFPEHRTTGLFEAYKQVLITGKPSVLVVSNQQADLKIAWARVKVLPVEDGIAITVSDISALKRAEERLVQWTTSH